MVLPQGQVQTELVRRLGLDPEGHGGDPGWGRIQGTQGGGTRPLGAANPLEPASPRKHVPPPPGVCRELRCDCGEAWRGCHCGQGALTWGDSEPGSRPSPSQLPHSLAHCPQPQALDHGPRPIPPKAVLQVPRLASEVSCRQPAPPPYNNHVCLPAARQAGGPRVDICPAPTRAWQETCAAVDQAWPAAGMWMVRTPRHRELGAIREA